jgi:fucose 4-O-acetylase-like acetyltransferase
MTGHSLQPQHFLSAASLVQTTQSPAQGISTQYVNGTGLHEEWLGVEIITWQSILVSVVLVCVWAALYNAVVAEDRDESAPIRATSRGRLHFIDNAKFFLMPAIVLTHMLAMPRQNSLAGEDHVRLFLASSHTRVYCFLSGYVATKRPGFISLGRLLVRVGAPYVVYCVFFWPFVVLGANSNSAGQESLDDGGTSDPWRRDIVQRHFNGWSQRAWLETIGEALVSNPVPTWYLLGIVWWVLASWTILWLPPAQRLVAATVMAIVAGYTQVHAWLPMFPEQIPMFFPVFIAGQVCAMDVVVRRLPGGSFTFGVAALLLLSTFMLETLTPFGKYFNSLPDWYWNNGTRNNIGAGYHSTPHVKSYVSNAEAVLFWTRFTARTMWCMTKGMFFLMMVPRSEGVWTAMGERSLYPFMLHFPLVGLFTGVLTQFDHRDPTTARTTDKALLWLLTLSFAWGLTTLLSTSLVQVCLQWCFEPSGFSKIEPMLWGLCTTRAEEAPAPVVPPARRRVSNPPEGAAPLSACDT